MRQGHQLTIRYRMWGRIIRFLSRTKDEADYYLTITYRIWGKIISWPSHTNFEAGSSADNLKENMRQDHQLNISHKI
jgi:hypothetical protein